MWFKKKEYEFNLGSGNADYFARMMMGFVLSGHTETAHRHLTYLMEEISKTPTPDKGMIE